MNISLPDEMKAFVEAQVATGLYANASDYIRDVIRERQVELDRRWTPSPEVIAAIEEGEASGYSDRSFADIMAEAKATFRVG
jgi:antitoxin ParD1/3/4